MGWAEANRNLEDAIESSESSPSAARVQPAKLLCLCICTRERSQMLAECLASAAQQPFVTDWSWELIVVENDKTQRCRDIVLSESRFSAREVVYVHEPELGISVARNAAIEEALRRGADWIAFIDDDECLRRTGCRK